MACILVLSSDTIMRLSVVVVVVVVVVVGIAYYFTAILVKIRIQDSSRLFSCSISYFLAGVCKDPGLLENGNVIGNDYSYNSSIRFNCKLGYDLLGPASLTCNKGTWNGGIPACKSKYIKPFQLHMCTALREGGLVGSFFAPLRTTAYHIYFLLQEKYRFLHGNCRHTIFKNTFRDKVCLLYIN